MPSLDRDTRVRSAIRRLLGGERLQSDLYMLCLWLRSPRTTKNSIPSEIGDFIAHSEERDKGITFQAVSDFYWTWCGVEKRFHRHPSHHPVDEDTFRHHVRAIKSRIHQIDTQQLLNLNPEAARQKFEIIAQRAKFDLGVGVIFDPPLEPRDHKIYDELTRHIISTPAFDTASLTSSFADAMIQNGILKQNEIQKWRDVVPFLSAYLMATMHRTAIKLADGNSAILNLVVGAKDSAGKLQIQFCFEVEEGRYLHTPVFSSDLLASDWCSEEIMLYKVEEILDFGTIPWQEKREFIPAIELSSDCRLVLSSTDVDAVLNPAAK